MPTTQEPPETAENSCFHQQFVLACRISSSLIVETRPVADGSGKRDSACPLTEAQVVKQCVRIFNRRGGLITFGAARLAACLGSDLCSLHRACPASKLHRQVEHIA